MKPIQSILILLSLILIFSCDDKPTNGDTDDMMSLDWILLKKVIILILIGGFYIGQNCDCVECVRDVKGDPSKIGTYLSK